MVNAVTRIEPEKNPWKNKSLFLKKLFAHLDSLSVITLISEEIKYDNHSIYSLIYSSRYSGRGWRGSLSVGTRKSRCKRSRLILLIREAPHLLFEDHITKWVPFRGDGRAGDAGVIPEPGATHHQADCFVSSQSLVRPIYVTSYTVHREFTTGGEVVEITCR